MDKNLVTIIMGSESDFEFCEKIGDILEKYQVPYKYRVASAHKTPEKVLGILKEDTKENLNLVYITVAGRSNALSGFVDFNTHRPVIACSPYSDKFAGVDIFSTLRMPSGSGLTTVLEPEAAALAAVKILGVKEKELARKIAKEQNQSRAKIDKADKEVAKYGKR